MDTWIFPNWCLWHFNLWNLLGLKIWVWNIKGFHNQVSKIWICGKYLVLLVCVRRVDAVNKIEKLLIHYYLQVIFSLSMDLRIFPFLPLTRVWNLLLKIIIENRFPSRNIMQLWDGQFSFFLMIQYWFVNDSILVG